MIKRILLFLVLNFTALTVGGLFTGKGVSSDWYQNLNQASWTPPGWVFGFMWTLIMICFAIYMAHLVTSKTDLKIIIVLFGIQWVLNVAWNPVFFHFQAVIAGLITISLLTILIAYFLFRYKQDLKIKALLILPYFIWLCIATSLNAYILFNN